MKRLLSYFEEFLMLMMALIYQDRIKRKTCSHCGRKVMIYKRDDGLDFDGHFCGCEGHKERWD